MTGDPVWQPKVGERIKYSAKSTFSGRVVNVQGMTVTTVTAAGYVSIDRRKGRKFKRGRIDPNRFYEHQTGDSSGGYQSWVEPVPEEEWLVLPKGDQAGQFFARPVQ